MPDLREQLEVAARKLREEEIQMEEQRTSSITEATDRLKELQRKREEIATLKKQLMEKLVDGFILPAGHILLNFLNTHTSGVDLWKISDSDSRIREEHESWSEDGDSETRVIIVGYRGVTLSRIIEWRKVLQGKSLINQLRRKATTEPTKPIYNVTFIGFTSFIGITTDYKPDLANVMFSNGNSEASSPTYHDFKNGKLFSLPFKKDGLVDPDYLRGLIDGLSDTRTKLAQQMQNHIDDIITVHGPRLIPGFPRL